MGSRERYISQTVPLGWMMCVCGEHAECPRDCERFVAARDRMHRIVKGLVEDMCCE
jgi:hypothetical protein